MNDFINKLSEIYTKITDKFDEISQLLYERTGKKINVGAIVLGAVLLLVTAFFVKELLKWLASLL